MIGFEKYHKKSKMTMTDPLYLHLLNVNGQQITDAFYEVKDNPRLHIFCSTKDHPVNRQVTTSSQYQLSCKNYKVGVIDDRSGNIDDLTGVERTIDERTVVYSYCSFLNKDKKTINKKGKVDGRLKVNQEKNNIDEEDDDQHEDDNADETNVEQKEEELMNATKRKKVTNTTKIIEYKGKTVIICVPCSIQECNQRYICGSCRIQHEEIGAYKFNTVHELRGTQFMKSRQLNLQTVLHCDLIDFNYYKHF